MHLYSLQAGQPITRQRRRNRVVPPLAVAATVFYAAPAAADTCSNLLNLTLLPNTKITLTQTYTAGQTVSGTTIAPVGLCRVAGTIKPGPKSNVHFEALDPDRRKLERQVPADRQRRVRRFDLAVRYRQRGVARLCHGRNG